MATKQTTTIPAEAATGLDLFVSAWLERWRSYGGWISYGLTDKALSGAGIPEPQGSTEWDSARFHGATRELLDLLAVVPGAKTALRRHVEAWPAYRTSDFVGA